MKGVTLACYTVMIVRVDGELSYGDSGGQTRLVQDEWWLRYSFQELARWPQPAKISGLNGP